MARITMYVASTGLLAVACSILLFSSLNRVNEHMEMLAPVVEQAQETSDARLVEAKRQSQTSGNRRPLNK